jgi:hypothetical protein
MTADYQPVVEIFQVIASIATAIALFFTITTFLRLRRTEQIGLGDRFFFELSRLRKEMDELGPQETRKKKVSIGAFSTRLNGAPFLLIKKR